MRGLLFVTTLAIVGCDGTRPAALEPPSPPAREAPTESQSTQPREVPTVAAMQKRAAAPIGPAVAVEGDRVTVDGVVVGSTTPIDELRQVRKIEELFDALRQKRRAHEETHPGEPFPGVVILKPTPKTSAWVFLSMFQSCGYAGYANVHVTVGDRHVVLRARVPEPPCGVPGEADCPPPTKPTPVMHIQLHAEKWWVWTRHVDGSLIRRSGNAPLFSRWFAKLSAQDQPGTFVFHVPKAGTFGTFAPALERVSRAGAKPLFLASDDIETLQPGTAPPPGPF
jgi:hypothetical protein